MSNSFRAVRYAAAIIAISAASAFNGARANHYILPCDDPCRNGTSIAIGPGITGTWFDPNQDGQGFVIEVLPGRPLQLLASWFVFAPEGGQSWIIASGPIAGTRAVLQANRIVGNGGNFPPNFDAANVHQEPWGTLTFTFVDCNHGHVDWVATAPGYGSGRMNLTRLTLPAGLTCQEGDAGEATGTGGAPN